MYKVIVCKLTRISPIVKKKKAGQRPVLVGYV